MVGLKSFLVNDLGLISYIDSLNALLESIGDMERAAPSVPQVESVSVFEAISEAVTTIPTVVPDIESEEYQQAHPSTKGVCTCVSTA